MIPTRPRKNNEVFKSLALKDIAELVEGELVGDPAITITGIAGIKEAKKGDITFLANVKYLPFLEETQASAVITSEAVSSKTKTLIRTKNPSEAFSKVIPCFTAAREMKSSGIHPTAVIASDARLGGGVHIGPHAVIESGVVVGDHSVIEANAFIGKGSSVGLNTHIYPNVSIYERTCIGNNVIIHSGAVIGSDGFGYETADGRHTKIQHVGIVQIDDDVEIGSNVSIDRGRFQKTWIKKGAKIDNLVQIAHNVIVGENCLIISQAGVSGSSELGKNVVVAGQAGIVGHVTLGENAVVGARAGVTKSVPADTVVLGQPAKPLAEQKKLFAYIARLPELFKEFAEFKKKLGYKV